MAIKLKPIADITTKWGRRAAAAGPDLEAGLRNPKTPWAEATKAAEAAQEAGVQDAISRKAFAKGVTKAGDEKWQRKALALAPSRYGPGINAAQSDYSTGFAPYRDALERIALPQKGRKGAPENIERVRVIASALRSQKVGGA